MSAQQLKTITCPSCSNINPLSVEECLKCGFDLSTVRDALIKAGLLSSDIKSSSSKQVEKPKPTIPSLPTKSKEDIGQLVEGQLVLIRGMANECNNLSGYFFQQLREHEIPDIEVSQGDLVVEGKTRDYFFIQRYLEDEKKYMEALMRLSWQERSNQLRAKATMAVRIFPAGKDLMVEWRNYVRTSLNLRGIATAAVKASLTYGISLLGEKGRDSELRGFENQDNSVLQLGVRAALEEAIDICGISHNLIQNMSKGKDSQRLI